MGERCFTGQAYLDPRTRRPAKDWLLAVVLLGVILLVVWFAWLKPPETAGLPWAGVRSQDWYVSTYGSNDAAIDRILTATDCGTLEAAFADGAEAFRAQDTTEAENRASVGIMAAAADRMRERGCPLD